MGSRSWTSIPTGEVRGLLVMLWLRVAFLRSPSWAPRITVVARTWGAAVEPLGRVLFGFGNDGKSGQEGCLYRNVVGTSVHGPLLPKNPGVADWLLARALERRYGTGELEPLDDAVELAANETMCARLLGGSHTAKP